VCHEIAANVESHKVVVVKSTVPVGTNDWVRRILVRYGASPKLFCVASNPEFLREGTGVTDFLYPDRIVIGSDCKRSRMVMEQLYQPLTTASYARTQGAIPIPDDAPLPTRLIVTHTRSAELIKHASNAFLAMKVSFINSVSNICEAAGADVQEVCEGLGSDQRIGNKFLKPGIGYGGSCFPKDLSALQATARECGYGFHLLEEVMRINEDLLAKGPQRLVDAEGKTPRCAWPGLQGRHGRCPRISGHCPRPTAVEREMPDRRLRSRRDGARQA
jgi:UDPglucose 6-dehydrogenase